MLDDPACVTFSKLVGRRVLVTGAAGALGAQLLRRLVGAGAVVHGSVRPGGTRWRVSGQFAVPGATLHELDVADRLAVTSVLQAIRPEFVFHMAVTRGHPSKDPAETRAGMLRTSVLGAHALLEAVSEYPVDALVVAGSSLEYQPHVLATQEAHALAPITWHGATKAAASLLYQQMARSEGLPVVLVRLFHVFGPWESAQRLAPTALRCALNGRPLALTDGEVRRDWVYVDDVCEAMVLAALSGQPGETFNVGSGVETSNEELVEAVQNVTGRTVVRSPLVFERRPTDAAHRVANIEFARARLGWAPRHDLLEGLRATMHWYVLNPQAWVQPDDAWASQL